MKTSICLSLVIVLLFGSSCRHKKPDVFIKTVEIPITQNIEEDITIPPKDKERSIPIEKSDMSSEDEEKPPFMPRPNTFEVRIEDINGSIPYKQIQDSGIDIALLWSDFALAWVTQEEFDHLKSQGLEIYPIWEWKKSEKDPFEQNQSKTKEIIDDPYTPVWKREGEAVYGLYGRSYLDLNSDGIPELLIPIHAGTGGAHYRTYQILQKGYLYLGITSYNQIQILDSKTNGFNDIISKFNCGAEFSYLHLMKFNGYYYEALKIMPVVDEYLWKSGIFKSVPDNYEGHPSHEKLLWSPQDDDKYRKMLVK